MSMSARTRQSTWSTDAPEAYRPQGDAGMDRRGTRVNVRLRFTRAAGLKTSGNCAFRKRN
jgi:hypothetical protein